MSSPILIIGQGISGTMLSWYLYKAGIPFIVIDNNNENTASKVAAGIINPVTGRRIVTTWRIDEIMPFAVNAYNEFASFFNIETVAEKSVIDFLTTSQMHNAFKERIAENASFLSIGNELDWKNEFYGNYNFGIIQPAYIIAVQTILATWRNFLIEKKLLITELFNIEKLTVQKNEILYNDAHFDKIIFADGAIGEQNSYFKNLPFALNKGEALIIKCNTLSQGFIYKKGITIAPIGDGEFWIGSNYSWNYEDEKPTEKFYNETKLQLEQWLKLPFQIIDHKAAIRPANVERRPFVGFHPVYNNVGIFNGMGAKGTSLVPFFANQFVQHLIQQTPIDAEVDVQRFKKVLNRKTV
jgi:glycine/D-amino acid oxidase-like deaminating enzyme